MSRAGWLSTGSSHLLKLTCGGCFHPPQGTQSAEQWCVLYCGVSSFLASGLWTYGSASSCSVRTSLSRHRSSICLKGTHAGDRRQLSGLGKEEPTTALTGSWGPEGPPGGALLLCSTQVSSGTLGSLRSERAVSEGQRQHMGGQSPELSMTSSLSPWGWWGFPSYCLCLSEALR